MKKKLITLTAALVLAAFGYGQVVVSTSDIPVVITFDSSVSGVSSGQWSGAGFNPSPTVGQLDSDAWAATGWSDGALAFGGTREIAATDYVRGVVTASVGTGGMYAFGTTDRQLMIQPGGSDWAPGTLTLKVQNGMGTSATAFSISYDLFVRNDQGRSNSFDFSYSFDGTNFITTDLGASFAYTSNAAADASPTWAVASSPSASVTMSSFLAADGFMYLRWSGADVGGSGSRDEFGLDNISVGMTAIPEPSTYAVIMGVLTLGFIVWRRRQKA